MLPTLIHNSYSRIPDPLKAALPALEKIIEGTPLQDPRATPKHYLVAHFIDTLQKESSLAPHQLQALCVLLGNINRGIAWKEMDELYSMYYIPDPDTPRFSAEMTTKNPELDIALAMLTTCRRTSLRPFLVHRAYQIMSHYLKNGRRPHPSLLRKCYDLNDFNASSFESISDKEDQLWHISGTVSTAHLDHPLIAVKTLKTLKDLKEVDQQKDKLEASIQACRDNPDIIEGVRIFLRASPFAQLSELENMLDISKIGYEASDDSPSSDNLAHTDLEKGIITLKNRRSGQHRVKVALIRELRKIHDWHTFRDYMQFPRVEEPSYKYHVSCVREASSGLTDGFFDYCFSNSAWKEGIKKMGFSSMTEYFIWRRAYAVL